MHQWHMMNGKLNQNGKQMREREKEGEKDWKDKWFFFGQLLLKNDTKMLLPVVRFFVYR